MSVAHHARDLGRLFLLWASAFQGGLFLAGGGIEGSGKTFSESVAQQGCTKCCPPLTQWVLLPCVEELGETVRAGLKQGTETLFPQMLRTRKGHAEAGQGGGRGWCLASNSPSEGLTQEAARVRWRSSGNARQLRGDVLSCPPPSLSIKYTPRRHSCAARTAASAAARPLLFFPLRRLRLWWLGGVACPGPHPPGQPLPFLPV